MVNETWFKKDSLGKFNVYNLKGYNLYDASRSAVRSNQNVVGGGIAIYISENLTHALENSFVGPYEKLVIKIRVNSTSKWIRLISYYRPPSHSNITDLLGDVENELNDDSVEGKIMIGDLNINLKERSNLTDEYNTLLESFNAKILNQQITRPKSNAIIDHVITQSIEGKAITHTIELPGFSDHNAILTSIEIEKDEVRGKTIQKKYVDHKKLEKIFKIDEAKFYSTENPEERLECISDAIIDALQSSSTVKTFKLKRPSILSSWLSVKVLELMRKKDHLYSNLRKRRKKNLPCDKLVSEIKTLEKDLKKSTLHSYKEHYNNMAKDGSIKEMWKEINDNIGNKKTNKKLLIEKNNNIITNTGDIANSLNDHFVNVGEKIIPASSISIETLNKFCTLARNEKSFFLDPTTCEEVFDEIRVLNKNKSAGSDEINIAIIKTLNIHLTPFITDLINCMFDQGIYPDKLKEGVVTPIPKHPKARTEDDFRPVTVLKAINKPQAWKGRTP